MDQLSWPSPTGNRQRHYSPSCRHIGVSSLFALGVHRLHSTQLSVSALLKTYNGAERWCPGEAVPRFRRTRLAGRPKLAASMLL